MAQVRAKNYGMKAGKPMKNNSYPMGPGAGLNSGHPFGKNPKMETSNLVSPSNGAKFSAKRDPFGKNQGPAK